MDKIEPAITPLQHGHSSIDLEMNRTSYSGSACSVSPGQLKQRRAARKRLAAANFLQAVLGVSIPHDNDEAFRASLADGVVLCQLLNALQPGIIPHIQSGAATPTSGVRQTFENVSNFLEAAQKFTTDLFSAADLEEPGERLQVVECILSLQDWHQASTSPAAPRAPACTPEPNGHILGSQTATPSPPVAPAFSFTPHASELVGRYGTGVAQPDGLNYLMQSCTHMLKTRMGVPATPLPAVPAATAHPEIALDAVGPVLETVLANLTSEYERRLLAKDQEHKGQAAAVEALRRQLAALQEEAAHWRHAAESRAAEEAAEAIAKTEMLKAQERAEYDRLRQSEAQLLCEVAAKRRELETFQAESSARMAAAEQELAGLRAELQRYAGLQTKYKAIQDENRSLYNTVQDLRGSIRVFCRVRPAGVTGDNSASVVEIGDDGAVAVYSHKHSKWQEYKFDRVFGESSTQREVYAETKPLVRSVLDGYNVCIFAYGQTGSGKTHTMSGVDDTAPGINYCSLSDLFEQCEERRSEAQYSIRVQLLEVYNETVRDLLVSEAEARQQKSLALVATRASGSNVPDATHVEVHSVEEVEEVMARGARNRAVAETRMNERSSRSHQVLTVMVEGTMAATRGRTFGCLHLIDLAGSERVARSGAQGQQLLEAQHINRSLTALGCVMQALAQKREHIPFRDSKLTQLLQDSLAGQAKSMMFMHIAPEETSSSETLSTLNFGKGVTEITLGAAKKNTESGALWELRDKLSAAKQEAAEERRRREALEGEVAALKARLEGARSNSSSEGEGGTDSDSIPAFRGSGLSRPAQVGRLDLSRLSIGTAPQREASPAPVSARLAHQGSSKIPTPVQMGAKLERRGSMTARPAFGQARASPSSADSVSASRRPLTSRGSPSELRSSLAAGSGGGGALQRSRSGLSTGSSAPVPTPRSRLAAAPSQSRRWQ